MGYNRVVLVISDIHAPYQHKDTLAFLSALADKYMPDRVVQIGDELDFHALSFHDTDPDLDGAGPELKKARKFVAQLEKLFPKMDLLESNHGSLVYRKAQAAGIPRAAIKSYNDILEVGPGWRWHTDLTLKMSNDRPVFFHHGKSGDAFKTSLNMSMSAVQGHYHGKLHITYWGNPLGLYWGMQVGCLIDDDALAYAYNKADLPRPIIGSGIIIDGMPKLLPLVKGKSGRWTRKIP